MQNPQRTGCVDFTDQQSSNDYYPFGSTMAGRGFSQGTYEFGFNGQEKDDELYSQSGSCYTFSHRILDSRIGRFLSIDPLTQSYPWNSTYSFAMNRVIDGIDLEGLEFLDYMVPIRASMTSTATKLVYYKVLVNFSQTGSSDLMKITNTRNKLMLAMEQYDYQRRLFGSLGLGGLIITNPPQYIATSQKENNAVIYDPDKVMMFSIMGKKPTPSNQWRKYYEYNGNSKPAAMSGLAYGVESVAKGLFLNSPMVKREEANADFIAINNAFSRAFSIIGTYQNELTNCANKWGYDPNQFMGDVMNFLVDGKSPTSGNATYKNFVISTGKLFTSKNISGSNEKKSLNVN